MLLARRTLLRARPASAVGAARRLLGSEHRSVGALSTLCLGSFSTLPSARPRPPLGLVHSALLTLRHSLASSGGRGRRSVVPRVKDIETWGRVLEVHTQHADAMRPIDASGCWNRLGKLARSDREQRRSLLRARCWRTHSEGAASGRRRPDPCTFQVLAPPLWCVLPQIFFPELKAKRKYMFLSLFLSLPVCLFLCPSVLTMAVWHCSLCWHGASTRYSAGRPYSPRIPRLRLSGSRHHAAR